MDEITPLLPSQSHSLPKSRLLIIFPAIALIQFTSFLDQTSIATSLPAIAAALDIGASISLVNACFLITSTSIQLINGRLSDIFGRKASLVTALSIMGLGNLLCGFAASPNQLFAARTFAGFGAGAINALVQIAIADVTTLEQRGYYFGMVGVATALGNGLGPLVGGTLTQKAGWPWAFWFVCPLCALAVAYLSSVWPATAAASLSGSSDPSNGSAWDRLKLVDWTGALASLVGIAMILIPISQGGSTLSWTSPVTILMLLTGVALLIIFLTIEWRYAKLPILPISLFRYGRSANILVFINILIGWIYWGNLFVLPLYLQSVRGASPSEAGLLLLPMVMAHGITSALSGILISMSGHYKPIIVTGAFCWVIAAIAKLFYDQGTAIWKIAIVGIFDGVGVGCSLQPVLIGLFANSDPQDRAVFTGLRNFLRDMGGAASTAVSGAIISNILYKQLESKFSKEIVAKLVSSAFDLDKSHLTLEEKRLVSHCYMAGLHAVFLSFVALVGIHLFAGLCIQDYGLTRDGAKKQEQQRGMSGTCGKAVQEDNLSNNT